MLHFCQGPGGLVTASIWVKSVSLVGRHWRGLQRSAWDSAGQTASETKPTFKMQRDEALNREYRLIRWDELAGTESMNDADARDGETVIWSPVGLHGGSASSCLFQEQHACLSFDPRNPDFAMKFLLPWNDCPILFDFQQPFHLFLYPVKLSSESSEAFTHRFSPASITSLVFASFPHTQSLPIEPWLCSRSGGSPHPAVVSISRLWLLLRGNLRLLRLISILMWHSPEDLTGLSRIKDGTYVERNNLSSNVTPQKKCSLFKCLPKLLKTEFLT